MPGLNEGVFGFYKLVLEDFSMVETSKAVGLMPIRWYRHIVLAVVIGLMPVIGHEVADALASWGPWLARLLGIAVGLAVGTAFYSAIWFVFFRQRVKVSQPDIIVTNGDL